MSFLTLHRRTIVKSGTIYAGALAIASRSAQAIRYPCKRIRPR